MWNLICRKLGDLASSRIQHRYIRDGTVDAYLLPEEAMEDAFEAIRIARSSKTLNGDHRRAVEQFATVFETSNPDLSIADFFESDPEWIRIRNAAANCLAQLGFDLETYENEQIALFPK